MYLKSGSSLGAISKRLKVPRSSLQKKCVYILIHQISNSPNKLLGEKIIKEVLWDFGKEAL